MTVPFIDLGPANRPVREAVLADIAALVDSGEFTNGSAVAEFERAWAAYCGRCECVGVSSGTDALRLSLLACGIEPGDEVVVPALTFVATWEAVTQAGGVPVPCDVLDEDGTMDPAAAQSAVTVRTRALIPVHLHGRLARMDALNRVALASGLWLVEDACQAHGAVEAPSGAEPSSAFTCFSFYPTKNLGAFGDAGAVMTDDEPLAARVRAFREHGQVVKNHHEAVGYTARLDTIQALVLLRKLPLLSGWNVQRLAAADFYAEALDGLGDLRLPIRAPTDVYHVYSVRTIDPDGLAAHLAGRGIGTGRHYPVPVHLTPAYEHLGFRPGSFPVAERIAAECLSLPLWPGISEAQQSEVVDAVRDWFEKGAK